jgi:Restriction endonuclease
MRYPNASCSICKKEFYRRPYEFKEGIEFCCRSCRSTLYKRKPSIWLKRIVLGHGWNKGMSKAKGDILSYGKPRKQTTKKLISEKLKGRIFTETHRKNISKARLALFDVLGRQDVRSVNGIYARWRKAVLERDNYTCQNCFSKVNLQAHHIKQWRYNPHLRYEVSNGLCLCVDCHRKTDSWGYKSFVLSKD